MTSKVSIIGAGNVGATCAQRIAERGYADIVLVDVVPCLPQGKALDILVSDAILNFSSHLTGTNDYEDTTDSDVVIIASGDMTHYEPQESAERKDNLAIEAILELDEDELLRRAQELDISMCAGAPAATLISAAKELGATRAELVKYQTSGDTTGDYSSVVGYAGIIIKANEMSPLTRLAKETVESYVREGKTPQPEQLTPQMKEKAGVFVSIHNRDELRGCIGTFEPAEANVAQEIIRNAMSSATTDPRFLPVTPEELPNLNYSVDVLTEPEAVTDKDRLDIKKYGVIVEADWRRGLLLPDLEGVDSVDHQIDICRQKAGIAPDEPVQLYRFEVKRYR